MSYTVRQLAEISGISIRTLHWYDEVGLLKPAYYGSNGYRYYEEEQLLLLQQILFFRELGFKLDKIQKVLGSSNFNKIRALKTHKHTLEKDLDRTQRLIETINKTILHLKGEEKMKDNSELYTGFDLAKQNEYEEYLVKHHGTVAEDLIAESQKKTVKWGTQEWQDVKEEGEAIYRAVSQLIEQGLEFRSDEVQELVERHVAFIGRFYTLSKDVYVGLSQLYCEHPGFRKFFDPYHPDFVEFFVEAMRFYAQRKMS